jgi:hypothetical protein
LLEEILLLFLSIEIKNIIINVKKIDYFIDIRWQIV